MAGFLTTAFLLGLTVALPAPHLSESTSGFGAPSIESATSIPYQQSWPTPGKTDYSEPSTGQPQTSPGSTSTVSSATITTVSTPASSGDYACATVSSLVAAAAAASSSGVPRIPAGVAWDCIQSVPLNATAGRLMTLRSTMCGRGHGFKTNSDRDSLGAVSGAIHKLADDDVLPEESASWLPTTRRRRLW
jgi:hypothetical protein